METNDPLLIEKVTEYERSVLKPKRMEHCIRVAETARKMCRLFNLDPDVGYAAGLAHDMCKDLDDEKMLELARCDGEPITDMEMNHISLLHGRAAAVMCRKEYGIQDADFLESLALHTVGGKDMCDLAKVVYAADKIEPGRPHVTEEYLESIFKKSLDGICIQIVKENMEYLESKEKKIAPITYEFLESLESSERARSDMRDMRTKIKQSSEGK